MLYALQIMESSPDVVREALSLGAQGYIHKLRAQTELLLAVKAILRGKGFVGIGLAWIIHDFASEKRKGALKD